MAISVITDHYILSVFITSHIVLMRLSLTLSGVSFEINVSKVKISIGKIRKCQIGLIRQKGPNYGETSELSNKNREILRRSKMS